MKQSMSKLVLFATAALCTVLPGTAAAQAWPAKPIKLVAPYATGGGPDILARLYAQEFSNSLGATLVENRPGASGNVGADFVAKSPPDGYTLLMTTTATHSINPSLYRNIPYDSLRDFSPVSLVAYTPVMLVVSNEVPARDLRELLAYAKANPGKLSYASAGPGSMQHISAELMRGMAGLELVHVPYKGTGQIVPDLVSGRVTMMFNSLAAVLPLVKDGKVRAIGVTTPARAQAAPTVPTLSEAGLPGFDASAWYAIYGPAGLPRDIVQRLGTEVARIVALPAMRERYAAMGLDPASSTPEQLADLTRRDLAKWAKVIRDNDIRGE
jgi:tripartite-type tricarboxylate transporter receptor subunit TctC